MVKQVQLGQTGLFVNGVGLGTNAVGGHNLFPGSDEEVGRQIVRTAIENGINLLDTAYMYGPERSEELIGEVVKESGKRSELVIATKVSPKFIDGKIVHDNSPAFLREEVEKSLRRLQTDYIDLLYIHFPDQDTPKDEAVGALNQLKEAGIIRAIGLSNFSLDQLKEANRDGYVDVFQGEYNLLNRTAEQTYFPYMREHKISFIPYYPLAAGILSGKNAKEVVYNDLRGRLSYFKNEVYAQHIEKVELIRPIAEAKGVDMAHVVLAWYLTRDVIDVVIPGAKRVEQVLNNLKAADVQLSNEEINEIDRVFQVN